MNTLFYRFYSAKGLHKNEFTTAIMMMQKYYFPSTWKTADNLEVIYYGAACDLGGYYDMYAITFVRMFGFAKTH